MVYYAVFGVVIILCLGAVGCLTGCGLVVASVFVALLCHDLTTTESRVKVCACKMYHAPPGYLDRCSKVVALLFMIYC